MRPRHRIEEELSHVEFLLDEMGTWNETIVPGPVRRHLTARYERQARLLRAALTDVPEASPLPPLEHSEHPEHPEQRARPEPGEAPPPEVQGSGPPLEAPVAPAAAPPPAEVVSEAPVAAPVRPQPRLRPDAAQSLGMPRDMFDALAAAMLASPQEQAPMEVASALAGQPSAPQEEAPQEEAPQEEAPPPPHITQSYGLPPETLAQLEALAAANAAAARVDTPWEGQAPAPLQASPVQQVPAPMVDGPVQPHTAQPFNVPREVLEALDELSAAQQPSKPSLLPPVTTEPLFDVPPPASTAPTAAPASAWEQVWKPFLYESVGWFLGAFLIVTGSLYFAFSSWEGMNSLARSLVVFGLTAGYSAAFSLVGSLLSRRESLAGAGRILGLIGSAVAPLASVALGPVDTLALDGVPRWLLAPLLLAWAAAAARMARRPAASFEPSAYRLLQAGLLCTTLMMGLAPLVARVGSAAFWLNALPCALLLALARHGGPRGKDALAFALGAPLYLLALFAVRLHLALHTVHAAPPLGSYAPMLAFVLAACLGFRPSASPSKPGRAADMLSLSAVALQATCLMLATTGQPPAFFTTAAVVTWTTFSLSLGAPSGRPWLYATYVAALLTVGTSGQLTPEASRAMIAAVTAQLGYASGELPFHFAALAVLPFILAGAALAAVLLAHAEREDSQPAREVAEVLLRSTAAASAAAVLLAHGGADTRPAFWAAAVLMATCIGFGLWLKREYLALVGAALVLGVPYSTWALVGFDAAVLCGLLALALAASSLRAEGQVQQALAAAVGWVGIAALYFGLRSSTPSAALAGMALAGVSGLVVAWRLESPALLALASLGTALVVPRLVAFALPSLVAVALGATALGLSALGERGGRTRLLGLSGMASAALALGWALLYRAHWLGVVLLCSAGALAVASRSFPAARPLAVGVAALALLPPVGPYVPWAWMTPALSVGLLALYALGASVAAARRSRRASTTAAGLAALLYLAVPLAVASGPQPYPLLLGAALAALLTARALGPTLAVVAAAALAGADVLQRGPLETLVLAIALTALALLELVPAASLVLTGGRRFALAASLSALTLTCTACLQEPGSGGPVLAGAALLPLLWMRATRQPPFSAASVLLPLLLALLRLAEPGHPLPAWWPALSLGGLVLTRAVLHVPAARSLLLGTEEERSARVLSEWLQWTLALCGLALEGSLLVHSHPSAPLVAGLFAAALLLLPGERPALRLWLAVVLLAPCSSAHGPALGVLLALSLWAHHRPKQAGAFYHSAPDARLRPAAAWGALVVAGASVALGPTPGHLLVLAGVLLVAAFLLSRRSLLTCAVLALALASVGAEPGRKALGEWGLEAAHAFAAVALGAALLSAVCQVGAVQRALSRLSERVAPGLGDTWSEPLWLGGALVAAVPLLAHGMTLGLAGALPWSVALLCGLAAVALLVVREPGRAYVAMALLTAVLLARAPEGWAAAAVSGAGLVLCAVGAVLDGRGVAIGSALHRGGWLLSLLAVAGVPRLKHPGMPVCLALGAGSAWAVVYRRPEREAVGWGATLVVVHALLAHGAAVHSTGRQAALILLYFGASMAVLALAPLLLAGPPVRRQVGLWVAGLALGEVLLGLLLVSPAAAGGREALVVGGALVLLLLGLGYRAVRQEDEAAAYLAQGALVLGYLAARRYGGGQGGLGMADSLVALAAGVIFSGLYVWVLQRGEALATLRRPALGGAFLFPLVGLLSAPWEEAPGYAAALLIGHSAHFAALGVHRSRRTLASLASAVAFNAALVVAWLGTHWGEPQYYIIPAGLSLLVLLRVFEGALEPDTRAQLRALTVTGVYAAGAWNPLLMQDGRDMVLCVLVCLVGVAAGVVLRIRSYVYLGSAFLVTCVLANLARYGMRDHRVGAAFLSLLGLAVVGFMVLLTARRAQMMRQYEQLRSRLSSWEG